MLSMIEAASNALQIEPPIFELTRGMIRATATAPPRMRVKAAEGRHLLKALRFILANFMPRSETHDVVRLQCVEALCRCFDCIGSNWTEDTPPLLAANARQFLASKVELHRTASSDALWKLYPKHHHMVHLSERGVNPVQLWNYFDESEIVRASLMAEKVHPTVVARRLVENERVFTYSRK